MTYPAVDASPAPSPCPQTANAQQRKRHKGLMRNTARQFPELISSQPSFPQPREKPGGQGRGSKFWVRRELAAVCRIKGLVASVLAG